MYEIDKEKLKELRVSKKLDQDAVGELIGRNRKHVSHYENGVAVPPGNVLLNYLIVFNVKPIYIAKKV